MKQITTIIFLICTYSGISQARVLLSQKGQIYRDTVRDLYVQAPLVKINDSTIGGGGGTPGGTSGQFQYNNAGTFGAYSNLYWDNTNSRLGIGISNPRKALSIQGKVNFGTEDATLDSYNITVKDTSAGVYLWRNINSIAAEPFIVLRSGLGALNAGNGTSGGGQIRGLSGSNGFRFTDPSSLKEYMRLDSAGRLSIGTNTPIGDLQTTTNSATNVSRGIVIMQNSADAVSSLLSMYKSRGSIASPSTVSTGDVLGIFDIRGYAGATNTYQIATRIASFVNGSATDAVSGVPADIRFYTSNGAFAERWRIDKNGGWTNTAGTPTAQIHLKAGTATAGTAPLQLTAGTNLTTPVAGTVEFDGTNYFVTVSTTRYLLTKTLTGTAAPATTPVSVGDHYIDTTNKKEYVATGTASSADWTILN